MRERVSRPRRAEGSEMTTEQRVQPQDRDGVATQQGDVLTVTDSRTGKTYELPIEDGAIRAAQLRQIKVSEDDFGLMSYDPAFLNTASCRSDITWIDGDKGELWHRGIPIEQLCESSSYLEVAYLLINGELPTKAQLGLVGPRHHDPHVRAREHQEVRGGLPLRRAPDGDAPGDGGRALDVLPGRQEDRRPARALHGDDPDDREDADARRVRLPAQPRPPVRVSGQRPGLSRATSSR